MSVDAMGKVFAHSQATGNARAVLLAIAWHINDRNGTAYPSVRTLATKCGGITDRAVQRALAKLVEQGELTVHRQAGGDAELRPDLRPNLYRLDLECPPSCDRTKNHRPIRLPRAPADLWTNGVTPASPRSNGVTPASPGPGDASVTQTVIKKPAPLTVPSPVTDRAREPSSISVEVDERCDVCGKSQRVCEASARTSGHRFEPVSRRARPPPPELDSSDDLF